MSQNDFICPRCNYSTPIKQNMRSHFTRKHPCVDRNDLELTDEIKDIVLRNHIYHRHTQKPQSDSTTTIINNYNSNQNIMNNIVHIDTVEKISKLLDYSDKELFDFKNCVDFKFHKKAKELDENVYPNFSMEHSDILGLIDDVTRVKSEEYEQMNILFDKRLNSIRMFIQKKWEFYWAEYGVQELIKIIKECYLNNYESYLIRKLYAYNTTVSDERCYNERLTDYYKFIANFDLLPYVCEFDYTDQELIKRELKEDNEHHLRDHYRKIYGEIAKEIKPPQKSKMRQHVLSIIKRNSLQNIEDLNRDIFKTIKMDEAFKKHLFNPEISDDINEC